LGNHLGWGGGKGDIFQGICWVSIREEYSLGIFFKESVGFPLGENIQLGETFLKVSVGISIGG